MFISRIILITMFGVFMAAGCSTLAPYSPANPYLENLTLTDELGDCARYFDRTEQLVAEHSVADAQYARVTGYPYLRINRLLASGLKPDPDSSLFDAWVADLLELGAEAHSIEYSQPAAPSPREFGRESFWSLRPGTCRTRPDSTG